MTKPLAERTRQMILAVLLPHLVLGPVAAVLGLVFDQYFLLLYGAAITALAYPSWFRLGGWAECFGPIQELKKLRDEVNDD